MTEAGRNVAYIDGWHAHKKGVQQSRNPYSEDTQTFSHNQWISGWCARFNARKHGQDLDLDEEYGF